MSLLRRTLLAVPVALTAVALFAATSRLEWGAIAADTTTASIDLDEDGAAAGVVTVVAEWTGNPNMELLLRVLDEDAPRWLDAATMDGRPVDQLAFGRVKDGVTASRLIPAACLEADAIEDAWMNDGDHAQHTCTVEIEVVFQGKSERSEAVDLRVEIGGYDRPVVDEASADMTYDALESVPE